MAKWGYKARLAKIHEACYMMAELEEMPTWDDLTLEEAVEIAKDVAEHCDEENGDWDDPECKADYRKAIKFLKDFA